MSDTWREYRLESKVEDLESQVAELKTRFELEQDACISLREILEEKNDEIAKLKEVGLQFQKFADHYKAESEQYKSVIDEIKKNSFVENECDFCYFVKKELDKLESRNE